MKSEGGGRDTDAAHLQVGARIRHARILKGMRMRDLALAVEEAKVDISPEGMRRLRYERENDRARHAALTELRRSGSRSTPTSWCKRRETGPRSRAMRSAAAAGVFYERLVPLAAGNLLEANIHNVDPGGEKSDPITHQGEAVGYLLEGEIDLLIDGTTYHMRQGDSFFFKAHLTNGYRNTGRTVARIIWVNTPQVH
jgi:quercetin dioxygenase-like cupin family protein